MLAGVALSALAILLLPEGWLAPLGLVTLRTDYPWAFGLAVVVPAALLLVEAIVAIGAWGKREAERLERLRDEQEADERRRATEAAAAAAARAEQERQEAELIEAGKAFLHGMTDPEKAICRKFIEGAVRTHWLNAEYGVVTELQRRGVIYQANQHMHVDLNFQGWGAYFTMRDWAWDCLHEHPELLVDKQSERKGRR